MVPSGSVKSGFERCCFHSKVSCCCSQFLCFLYTFFPSQLLFFRSLFITPQLMFNVADGHIPLQHSFGKAPFQRVLCIPSTHTIYTHGPILTADVIWPFCCRWTLQIPPQMQMKSQNFKYRMSAPELNLMVIGVNM